MGKEAVITVNNFNQIFNQNAYQYTPLHWELCKLTAKVHFWRNHWFSHTVNNDDVIIVIIVIELQCSWSDEMRCKLDPIW